MISATERCLNRIDMSKKLDMLDIIIVIVIHSSILPDEADHC